MDPQEAFLADRRFSDAQPVPAAFAPKSRALALVTTASGQSTVSIYSGAHYDRRRFVFSGAGDFGGLAWSPDGRPLLIDWRGADQWIFIRFRCRTTDLSGTSATRSTPARSTTRLSRTGAVRDLVLPSVRSRRQGGRTNDD